MNNLNNLTQQPIQQQILITQPTTSSQIQIQPQQSIVIQPQQSVFLQPQQSIVIQPQQQVQQIEQSQQSRYQYKCSLLEYHIQEAILVNKALRSEVQQYREKIDFERRLKTALIERVKHYSS